MLYGSIPESDSMSLSVFPRPQRTFRMIPTSPLKAAAGASLCAGRPARPTLLSVLTALEHRRDLSPNRWRDLRSGVTRMAKLIGEAPACIVLNLPAINAKLAAINAAGVGLTP